MQEQTQQSSAAPTKGALAKATGIALLVALFLLFTAVLPAEYGFDPLKTGAALGLNGIAQSGDSSGRAIVKSAPGQTGVYTPQPGLYKVESEDFLLMPGDTVEMKYHMVKGASMVYGWKADAKLPFEFHGEPDKKPKQDYYESYLIDKAGKDSLYGSFIAPSTGIHGWFWQNNTKQEIRFHLWVSGFFDSAKMYTGGPPEEMPIEDVK